MTKLTIQVEYIDVALISGAAKEELDRKLARWDKLSAMEKVCTQALHYALRSMASTTHFHYKSGALNDRDIVQACESRSTEVAGKYREGEKPAPFTVS